MTSNGREDSGRTGIILGSDVVLRIEKPGEANVSAIGDGVSDVLDARSIVDESVVQSTARASERALLALVDGRRSVQELVRLSGMSDVLARRNLRALCERGVLVPTKLPEPAGADSGVPQRTTSRGSGDEADRLSRALTDYLDSGKTGAVDSNTTATVVASAHDAVTVKAAVPDPGLTADATPSKVVVGSTPETNLDASLVVSRVPVIVSPGDADAAPQVRFKSPPAGVIAGEWPRRSNTPSAPVFKPNITAFWVPSASDPAPPLWTEPPPPSASQAPMSASDRGPNAETSARFSVRAKSPGQGTIVVTGTSGASGGAEPTATPTGDAIPTPVSTAGSRGRSGPIPFRLGEYEVATRIAQGGMGSIYVCRRAGAAQSQRLFTLKVVRQHSKQVAQVIQSFRREARVGALLNHQNLQTVVNVGTYHEQPFLILDYVEGIGLADLMAGQKRLPPAIVVSILLDVLRGLKAAHDLLDEQGTRLGLVHGDISPQNILVGVDGNARLTDFGSARFSSDSRAPEAVPVLMGKPAFMSPEQLCADPIDGRTDLFSLGVVMWTALTGQSLFVADSYDQIVMNIFRKKIPPPSEFGAPACFDEIAAGALSRAPDGRYANADEMANALSRVARSEGIVGSPFDVGQWVRREFAETLSERRRRVQVVFGGPGVGAATPEPTPIAPARLVETPAPPVSAEDVGATSADGFARLPARTIQLSMGRRETPRLTTLTASAPPRATTEWRVVFVSAIITFPFALALTYFVSNPIVRRLRDARSGPSSAATIGVGAAPTPGGGAIAPYDAPKVAPPIEPK